MTLYTKRWVKGLVKSWTAHAGTWIAVLGYLQTQDKLLTKWVGENAIGGVLMTIGILVIVLRAKTNESLESKGTQK